MTNTLVSALDALLLIVLPYAALIIFVLVSIRRYRREPFSYSSLSSQFLEHREHFWGLVPFHYGIITVLTGHLIGFLIPREVLAWNSQPLRLYILEVTAFLFGLLTMVGLVSIIIRRHSHARVKAVTSAADWIILGMLLVQVSTGLYVAVFHSWGSSWYAAVVVPYLWSLVTLSPNTSYIAALPWIVKTHFVGAYLIIAFFPFTRLVHVLVMPNPYLWRKPQVVRWYGIRRLSSKQKALSR